MFKYLSEHLTDLNTEDAAGVFLGENISALDLRHPVPVLLQIAGQLLIVEDGDFQTGQFILQAGGQNRQTHDLNQADVLFLDMMELAVGMEDAERVFCGGDVVAQNQIQLVILAFAASDGRDCIMA